MKSFTVRKTLGLGFTLLGLLWSASSHSVVVLIDEFAVQKNGANFFTDTFSGSLTPSQQPGTYNVTGAFPNGAQSGGRLTLNSDWGELTQNAAQQSRLTLGTQLISNVDPARPTAGLTVADRISVRGVFSLVTPPGPLTNGYGIQVQNIIQGQGATRVVELDVQYNANFGGDVIRFLLQDFTNNTITTLGYVPFAPPGGADQIELDIFRPDASNNDFLGAFAFGTGGVFGSLQQFSTAGSLFGETNFVRARFIDFTAIPEPGTLALLGFGLAGLAFVRRRKH